MSKESEFDRVEWLIERSHFTLGHSVFDILRFICARNDR